MNQLVTQERMLPAHTGSISGGNGVRAIVPQNLEDAYRIANAIVTARMAPDGLDTPEKAMVAIMHGMEVGLTPMAALQSIAVVNGRPTIWGDGAIGLVRGSGKLEYLKERIEGDGDGMVAICEVKRKGEPAPEPVRFSVEDAKKAGLWGKTGRSGQPTPWVTYPKRMLTMRARAFALRDNFADVLRGLGIAEEVQDMPPMRDVTPSGPPPAPGNEPEPENDGPPPAPPMAGEPSEDEEAESPSDILGKFETWCDNSETPEDLESAWSEFEHHLETLPEADADTLKGLYHARLAQLEPNNIAAG